MLHLYSIVTSNINGIVNYKIAASCKVWFATEDTNGNFSFLFHMCKMVSYYCPTQRENWLSTEW